MHPSTTTTPTLAGLPRRLAAAIYDGFLLFAVLFAAGALYGWVYALFAVAEAPLIQTNDIANDIPPIAEGWLYQAYLLGVTIVFYAGFWARTGQTLGMQAWRIQLQQQNGQRLVFTKACLRVIVAMVSGGPLAMIWIPFNRNKHALFDIICHTRVVVVPKKPQ